MDEQRANAEDVNDEAKLLMHRMIARRLPADPAMIARARAMIPVGSGAQSCDEWIAILELDPAEIRTRLTARDANSTWLRKTSPFGLVSGLPLQDYDLRIRIWRDSRRLVEMRDRNAAERAAVPLLRLV